MKVSIIVAVYNGAKTLARCLDSIRQQTSKAYELVVMDGGSSDGTRDMLSANEDLIAYWESKPDKGIYHAWNKALDHITGDWVIFLGADDYLCDSTVIASLEQRLLACAPDQLIAYGELILVSEDGTVLDREGRPWPDLRDLFVQEMNLPHPAVLYRAAYFQQFGRFDESFRIAADYEIMLRYLPEHEPVFLEGLCVTVMQHGGISKIAKKPFLGIREHSMARRNNGKMRLPNRRRYYRYIAVAIVSEVLFKYLGNRTHKTMANLYRGITGRPLR